MSRGGFTLVELLVATGISGLVLGLVYAMFSAALGGAAAAGRAADEAETVLSATAALAARLRYAERIDEPRSGGEASGIRLANLDEGEVRLALEAGELVETRTLGLGRKVLATGLADLRIGRKDRNPHLVQIDLAIPRGRRQVWYRTFVYARGTRRLAEGETP